MSILTRRQTEILNFIRSQVRSTGVPPTREDIALHFGFTSRSSAQEHLVALARHGYVSLIPGSARGIQLIERGDETEMRAHELPLVGRIAAGSPITAPDNIESWLKIDPELFRPRADFLCRVSGHSMKDAGILDGDLVGIRALPQADNGQIIAAVLPHPKTGDDEITLKRYFRRRNRIVLKPENASPSYRPIEIDLAEVDSDTQVMPPFRIAGIFAGLIRMAL